MRTTPTQQIPFLLSVLLFFALQLTFLQSAQAQGNAVPVFEVDLTGQPNGIWNSGSVQRNGQICGADKNENCIQFNITLDKNAGGLEFSITDTPVPPGAMTYRINCGPEVPVGQPICVSGTGPHVLTICMPGNAKNQFQVKSIAAFTPQTDVYVSGGCTAILRAPIAFEEASVTWTDVTGGGAYNSYLSCTSGCSTPTVTPGVNPPAFVDYVVCGQSVMSPCSDLPYCDTVRVYFFPAPVVTIGPSPAIICPGSSGVELVGNVTGGSGNFTYLWTDVNGNTLADTKNYLAPAVGEYFLEVRTENYPNCKKFSAAVTVVSNLKVNAGADQLVCRTNPVNLSGTVTAALGGIWSGGAGTFSPSNTALNAIYTPTANELAAGSLQLTLISTGNGSCAPVQDNVRISFYSMDLSITGPAIVCMGSTASLTASTTGAQGMVNYLWNTGETTATINNKPAGTYTVKATDGNSCILEKSFTVVEKAGPADVVIALTATTCGASNGKIDLSNVTGGTAPYLYRLNAGVFQTSTSFTDLASGSYTVTIQDANGCTLTKTVTLQNVAGPAGFTASAQASTCGNSNGIIQVSSVVGGTAPYTYSRNNSTFQTSASFVDLAAGSHTLTVKDANGCIFSKTVPLTNIAGPSGFALTAVSSTCGDSNGSLTVGTVTGGTAPFSYSKDGITFQTNALFGGLAAGTHTITTKDANGCLVTKTGTVTNVAGPSNFTAIAKASTCSGPNGELAVTGVTGGTAPYTYSKDGSTFQTGSSFTGLVAGSYTLTVKDANGCVTAKSFIVTDQTGPSAFTLTPKASTCGNSNGTVAVSSIIGGTAPYTYSKDGSTFQTSASFTALAAGLYSISAKDANGCLFTKQVEVKDIAGPSGLALASGNSTCGDQNGTITVNNVTGGTAPFSFSLNGGSFGNNTSFPSLLAGEYTVTVKDANGCTFFQKITVLDVAGPRSLVAKATASTCGASNGQLRVSTVTGGTAPYGYSKDGINFQSSDTFLGLSAGTYSITVKDANGCSVSASFGVTNIPGPTALAATTTSASCLDTDGSLTVVTVTGGTAPYVYSLSGGAFQTESVFASLASGTYAVTARDANGCLVSASVTVAKNIPTAFATTSVSSTCAAANGSLSISSVSGGTGPYTYSINAGAFQNSATFSGLSAGTYSLTVKDAKGCLFTRQAALSDVPGPNGLSFSAQASTCGAANGSLTVSSVNGGTAPFTYSLGTGTFQASAAFSDLATGSYTLTVRDANGCTFTRTAAVSNIAGPSAVVVSASPASCQNNDGSLTATSVSGGTAPYSYSLNGTSFQTSSAFSGLAAGTYTLTVRDANGCLASGKASVGTNVPAAFVASANASTCGASNGSVTVSSVTGGTAPYAYSVDGGTFQASATLSGLASGNRTITVRDAKGCTFTMTVAVANIPGPTDANAAAKSSTCGSKNGELTVTEVTGGTEPYTYSIDGNTYQASASFTGLLAGNYQVRVKDANGCLFTKTVIVTNITGPSFTSLTKKSTCGAANGEISVTVSGGTAPYTYSKDGTTFQASATFTNLLAGTYTISVIDSNDCLKSASVTVANTAGPSSLALQSIASTCGDQNGRLAVTGVTGGTSPYVYSLDGINFQSSSAFEQVLAGTYSITVKDANGCTFAKTITVTDIAGPSDFIAQTKKSTCGASNGEVVVGLITGGTAPYSYSKDGTTFQASATFTSLPANDYVITVKDANGCLYTEQVVVGDVAGPSNFTASLQPSSCGRSNGGISVASVTGGTAPYTYSKDGISFQTAASFASLAAGTYTIAVKDANGCLYSTALTVVDVAGPRGLTLSPSASTCGSSNGSISVTNVDGGTAPFTFSLDGAAFQSSPSFGSLKAGQHTVVVKDINGCTFSSAITVNDVAGPSALTADIKPSTCGASNGQLAITAVTGGTAPYRYSKDGVNFQTSASFTDLAAGNHTFTVKDANGCTVSRTFALSNVAGPSAAAAKALPASCQNNDGSVTVTGVTGGTAPYSYSINGEDFQADATFLSLASGTYVAIARDANGCLVTVSVTVGTKVPTSFTTSTVASTCGNNNGTLTITSVTSGTGPFTYSLNSSPFQTVATFSGLGADTYSVSVKDAKGCTIDQLVTLSNTSGPAGLTFSTSSSTCGGANGSITVTGVSGGVAPYTYSKDGVMFQTSATFTSLLAGQQLVWVKDANGCVDSQTATVDDIAGPSALTATAQGSTCGNANGSLLVTSVTGGTAPYTYSKDGVSFQTSASFSALLAGTYTFSVKDSNGCLFSQQIELQDVAGPSALLLSSKNSTCGSPNGMILVGGVTGGTAPYTFSLDGAAFQSTGSFGSVLAGEHQVRVRDANGCIFAMKISVSDVAGPTSLLASTISTTCGGTNGQLTVTDITGGTSPFTFSRDGINFQTSPTFTGLSAGNHPVVVKDANGCTISKTVAVSDIAGPSALAASSQPASCLNNDGTLTVTEVTGGTAPFTYSINGSTFQPSSTFIGLAATSFAVTAKDVNGCVVTASVTVGKNVPSAFTSSITASTCGSSNGGLTINTVTGGTAPYTYSLGGSTFQSGTSFGNLPAGTYSITVKDAKGCTFQKSVAVSNIAGPMFTAVATASTCGSNNGSIAVSGVTGGTAPYLYSKDGVTFQSDPSFSGLLAGSQTISVKDANGCLTSQMVVVEDQAGPTTMVLTMQNSTCGNSNGTLTITSVSGGTAPYTYSRNTSTFQTASTFSGLTAGLYSITVKDANGCLFSADGLVNDIAGPSDLILASTSSTCAANNGAVLVNGVTGGTTPYRFALDGGVFQSGVSFGELLAGEHTVVVQDANGCTFSKTILVTDVAGPSNFTFATTSSTCGRKDGELSVLTVAGSTAPYTYSLDGINFRTSGTFSGIASGNHFVQVKDANGCIFGKIVTVQDILGPTAVNAISQPASCADNDGAISIGSVTGGTAPFMYALDGGTFQSSATFTALASGTYTLAARDANGCEIIASVEVIKNVPASFAFSANASTCGDQNGSLSVGAVTGGFAPYTYSVDGFSFQASSTFTGLLAGTHTLTVKDAKGCTTSRQVRLDNIDGPSDLKFVANASTCGETNGQLTVEAVGGTAPYTYSRNGNTFQASGTFTALAAGSYTITVKDANGCRFFKEASVTDVAGPTFTASSFSSTCGSNNGRITIGEIIGGQAPYTYSKDGNNFQTADSFAGLVAGTYTILVKDANGCRYSRSIEIQDIPGPTQLALTSAQTTCGASNGTIQVEGVTGGTAPYSFALAGSAFQPSTTFSAVLAGIYEVVVKDANGCTFAAQIQVTDIAGPSNLTATTVSSTCGASNGSLTITNVTGGSAPFTYSKDGVNFQTSSSFTDLLAGNHTLTVKDANGCLFTKSVPLADVLGPTKVVAVSQPASCQNNDGSIIISGVTGGTAPYTYALDGATYQTSASFTALPSGMYTVTARDANGCLVTTSVTILGNVPTDFIIANTASTCGANNGSLAIGTVTGGTAPYTFSINGVDFQASSTFAGLAAGDYSLTVKDAKGCLFAKAITLENISGPTAVAFSAKASTCGNSNGEVTISSVTGGNAPFSYSKDGVTFQNSPILTSFAAGTHTITVRDANGCVFTESIAIDNMAGPTDLALKPVASTCGNSNGTVTVGSVEGGNGPFTYSKDGVTFQSSDTFTGLASGNYTITVKDANGCRFNKAVQLQNLAGPSDLALSSASSTCGSNNGTITVDKVTAGTAPYLYAVNGSAFQSAPVFGGMIAGTHTIMVKDVNGCTFSRQITVGNVAGPSDLVAAFEPSTCGNSNGALTLREVVGGTAPYTYSKNSVTFHTSATFTDLAAGQHTLTVKDANGCVFAKVFTLTNVAGPTAVSATTLPASCLNNDGTISVASVTGGTNPYAYALDGVSFQASTTFSSLAVGTYTLTAKDANGCLVTTSVTVGTKVPTSFVSSTVASTCGESNGSMTITSVVDGTAPYLYMLNGSAFQASSTFANLMAGTYTVSVKDANGCIIDQLVTLDNISGPTILDISTEASTCNAQNGKLAVNGVTGGTGPYTYSIDGFTFQASPTFGSLLAGQYLVVVRDANGCVYTQTAEIINTAGPTALTLTPQASTCGNRNGTISVGGITGGTAPFVYSLDGAMFQSGETFTTLVAGVYTVTVKDANGCTVSGSVTVSTVAGPTGVAARTTASTCGGRNGSIAIDGVTGGTAPYTFSVDGVSYQTAGVFAALAAGEYTVTVKDANGCTFAQEVAVANLAGPTSFLATTSASTCGEANGQIMITKVSGGTAPYLYSKDGVNFQASGSFSLLLAGSYTFTVKDANSCLVTQTISLSNVNGPEQVTTTLEPASCQNNDGSITVTGVTGGTAPYTYSLDGGNFQTASGFGALASGTHTLRVKDANGCEFTTSVEVRQNLPTAFAFSSTSSTCGNPNGSLTIGEITGGKAPFTYSLNGGTFQTSQSFGNLSADTYTISVKDAAGCTFDGPAQVRDAAGITDLTLTVEGASCNISNGSFSVASVTGGAGPYTYSLNGSSFQASGTFAALAAGTYTLLAKDANGCTYSESVLVPTSSGPTVVTASAQAATCGSANGTISVNSVTGGNAPYQYSIDGSTFSASTSFTQLLAGTYTLTVKDASGCTFSTSVVIEGVDGPDNFDVATVGTTCGGDNGSITVSNVTDGTAPFTYKINGRTYQPSATFLDVKAGSYSVTVLDANGCASSRPVTVTDQAGISSMTTSVTDATCTDNGTITVTGTTGGTAPFTYSLDGTSYQTSATFSALAPATYTVYVKDGKACRTSVPVTVGSSKMTAADVTSIPATCGQSNGAISISGITGGTQPWTYRLNGGSFQTLETFTGLAAGTYTVTIRDAAGCILTTTKMVTNSGGPDSFSVTATQTSCGNTNGRITISGIAGGQSPYTYSINGTNFQTVPEFTGLAAGTYSVSVMDASGCVKVQPVSVGSIAPMTQVQLSVTQPSCAQTTGQISIGQISGGQAPYAYSVDGITFTASTTFIVSAGTYTVTVKDAANCTISANATVNSIESKVVSVTDVTCGGEANGRIVLSTKGWGNQVEFSVNNGNTFQKDSVFTNLAKGTYQIILKSGAGCSANLGTVEVNEPELMKVSITVLTKSALTESEGTATIASLTGGTAPFTYKVDDGQFSSATTFQGLSVGTHTLVVQDSKGCQATASFQIEEAPAVNDLSKIEIPNGFTPNGDGINDLWVLKNLPSLYPNCKVAVYNRWGNLVFESEGYKKAWDGTYNGEALPVGTYYTIIELGGREPAIKKSVTIMR